MQIDDRFRAANIKQVEIERIVKSIIKDKLLLVYYIVFGKELVKAKNKHKGEMLRNEVEILQNKWSSRGLNTDLMDVIKNALSVPYVVVIDTGLTEAQANLLYWRLDCTNKPSIGYWIHQGNFKITGNLELTGNLTDNGNSVTVANIKTAYDHSQVVHDYAYITANDGATNVTAAELEELSDGSTTVLHDHDVTGLTNWPTINYAYVSGKDAATNVTAAELEELSDGSLTVLHSHTVAAAGNNTEVQYNDSGARAGASLLTYDKANDRVGVGGAPAVGVTGENLLVTGDQRITGRLLLDNPPRCRMYKNSAQSVASGGAAATVIQFDAESYDSGAIGDTAAYTITPTEDGYYFINTMVKITSTVAAKYYRIYVYVNNVLRGRTDYQSATTDRLSLNTVMIVYVGAGEAIDVRLYHNSGANVAIETGENVSWFEVHRLS